MVSMVKPGANTAHHGQTNARRFLAGKLVPGEQLTQVATLCHCGNNTGPNERPDKQAH